MILSNTKKTIQMITDIEKEINHWFLENFDTALYIAGGFTPCSANDLKMNHKEVMAIFLKYIKQYITKKKLQIYSK